MLTHAAIKNQRCTAFSCLIHQQLVERGMNRALCINVKRRDTYSICECEYYL